VEHLVFGLDIGTRSIVGSVGYLERDKFNVLAHFVKEHETRAMLDGQIHDINKVGESIHQVKKELERQLDKPLNDVCIAAAGRVLKTVTVHVEHTFDTNTLINSEHISYLDLLGVEKALEQIRMEEESDINFICVGYSVVKYYLNDYIISNLEGHKGKKAAADVLATFLPEEVVDGLYASVNIAGLQVANLTLEPIAAINIAIPDKFRLLNIALVDVGAGTSDISITKDGSIIAYGMIPSAGDEITETIVQKFLVDFYTAETMKRDSVELPVVKYKDIFETPHEVPSEEVAAAYNDIVENITKEVADKIIELNGQKTVSAVFVVGGGGKATGFTNALARHLNIDSERVALRGAEVLGNVNFEDASIVKDPILVTPIGICLNFYNQKNNFILVHVNDERIKLYNNDKLTVANAALHIGFSNEALFPKSGKEINFMLNGKERLIRGQFGEPAEILVSGELADINTPIQDNDKIIIRESVAGEAAKCSIKELSEYNETIRIMVNDQEIICPRFAQVNGKLESGYYSIQDGDDIKFLNYYTIEQLFEFLDIDRTDKEIYLNNESAEPEDKVYENFSVKFEEGSSYYETKKEAAVAEIREITEEEKITNEIVVFVNGTPIILTNKKSYVFADIFENYKFDLHKVQGSDLVAKINGEKCGYSDEIADGDKLELYWTD
jgi:cell division protein FtsA